MHKALKKQVELTILAFDSQAFADRFYNYTLGNSEVLQIEVYNTVKSAIFIHGTGGHSRQFMDYCGKKFSVHLAYSSDFVAFAEEFKAFFKSDFSPKLKQWMANVKKREEWLQRSHELETLIINNDTKKTIKKTIEALRQTHQGKKDCEIYNAALITDFFKDERGEALF